MKRFDMQCHFLPAQIVYGLSVMPPLFIHLFVTNHQGPVYYNRSACVKESTTVGRRSPSKSIHPYKLHTKVWNRLEVWVARLYRANGFPKEHDPNFPTEKPPTWIGINNN